jgi:hypothetical protein
MLMTMTWKRPTLLTKEKFLLKSLMQFLAHTINWLIYSVATDIHFKVFKYFPNTVAFLTRPI